MINIARGNETRRSARAQYRSIYWSQAIVDLGNCLTGRVARDFHFFMLDLNSVLVWFERRSEFSRVNLSELSAEKQNLRRIISPEEQGNKRAGRAIS